MSIVQGIIESLTQAFLLGLIFLFLFLTIGIVSWIRERMNYKRRKIEDRQYYSYLESIPVEEFEKRIIDWFEVGGAEIAEMWQKEHDIKTPEEFKTSWIYRHQRASNEWIEKTRPEPFGKYLLMSITGFVEFILIDPVHYWLEKKTQKEMRKGEV